MIQMILFHVIAVDRRAGWTLFSHSLASKRDLTVINKQNDDNVKSKPKRKKRGKTASPADPGSMILAGGPILWEEV